MLVFRLVLKDLVHRTVTKDKPWRIFVQKLFFLITAKRMHSVESENTETKMSYYLSVGQTQDKFVFTSQHSRKLVYTENSLIWKIAL